MKQSSIKKVNDDLRYLRLLSRDFPTISSVTTEIINLEAILHLPKPTEHFLADLHGENEAFQHVLRNASGNIKRKVNELFGTTLREQEKKDLCTLIYYPEQKLDLVKKTDRNISDYYQTTLNQLVAVCRRVSSKYTRSKVRKSLPPEYAYIIEELMHESTDDHNKQAYVNVIIQTIIGTTRADNFIIALCYLIQRLAIDQLHVLGDIYDRGPGAHLIMDVLESYHNWDLQWGNHDILWMGAAAGNPACVASVLRISLRYANLATIEDGYAINLVPLTTFSIDTYGNDECTVFKPKIETNDKRLTEKKCKLIAQMHKAISIIQFKLEGQLYNKHPEWKMDDRKLLDKIDFEKGIVTVDGNTYEMLDMNFPTIDPKHPFELTKEEKEVVDRLCHSFLISDRLQRHINVQLTHGSMYGIYNSNLLYHASVPLNEDGSLHEVSVAGQHVKGVALLERVEQMIRSAYDVGSESEERQVGIDYFWYLWCGPESPLFDKSKMSTFERYFIADKSTHVEEKGWYYKLRDSAAICDYIMDEFGVKGEHRHIINGHVPVKVGKGEKPIKADGRLMVIDGGFAKAYHNTTGIAGYTLVYHSRGFQLVQHAPFTSTEEAILNGTDIQTTTQIVEMMGHREMVADSDKGVELSEQVSDLEKLLMAYRKGIIKERK
ncbi:fructose-1,6-bisphosphatase [Alloprevotella tannerae]|mgnify:FL=1|uniref:fructose-1,6-bisphosphatase n=1 Tax=Alloprevotella tannerae TaxID=76122 RepID=UPI001EDC734D|nr:fructose-1,6-bisphosphatase [Alloprevotella tannerae]MCG2646081.1 fructose-1,6-bisphosphatase [Alloprevotella tannerae]MCG2650942.1 fructose-1,6-bisphosphatase [Alloprevotella tannerae]